MSDDSVRAMIEEWELLMAVIAPGIISLQSSGSDSKELASCLNYGTDNGGEADQ